MAGLADKDVFNQPITGKALRVSLTRLIFGVCFDQPINNAVWPANLTELALGVKFDSPINGAK